MKNAILLFTFLILASCKTLHNQNSNTKLSSYSDELISLISQKEGIENNEQVYFHINIKDLGSDFYLTKIALNGVKPEKYSFKSTYAKFETYVYVDTDRSLKINNKVFYVPDSNNWEFIIYAVGDRIISIEKLTPYELIKENSEGKIKL